MQSLTSIDQRLAAAERLWLFLDYDGTLADFAPTPDHVTPDPEVVGLLARLVQQPRILVAVVSGRRLNHVEILVPVPGILLAGTYGVELRLPNEKRIERVPYHTIRPTLDSLKPRWEALIANHHGFFLEDKGWALALHARFAADDETEQVLTTARHMATIAAEDAPADRFRILGGHKFLEIGPRLAHKGRTIDYLLDHYPVPGTLPVYMGDDDKDEEAFGAIQARGGIAILVAAEPRDSVADLRLESPQAARRWLETLLARQGIRTSPPNT
jgi:trehalose 6-phosphate phosphatase